MFGLAWKPLPCPRCETPSSAKVVDGALVFICPVHGEWMPPRLGIGPQPHAVKTAEEFSQAWFDRYNGFTK
jgi:hypothetical protein